MSEQNIFGPRKGQHQGIRIFSQAINGGDHLDMDQAFNGASSWN